MPYMRNAPPSSGAFDGAAIICDDANHDTSPDTDLQDAIGLIAEGLRRLPDGNVQEQVLCGFLAAFDNGPPIPALTSITAEADAWAAYASRRELKIYTAAAVVRFGPADRASLAAYLARPA